MSAFSSIMLDGVTFSRVKNSLHTCKCLYFSQSSLWDFFHVMAENWKHLKDTLACSSFLVCENQNRILLTNDLLRNIFLVVGQSSVNISLSLLIRAFSDFKAFLYILIGSFSIRGCYHIKTPNFWMIYGCSYSRRFCRIYIMFLLVK